MSRSDGSKTLPDEWLRFEQTHLVNNKEKEPANPRWYIGLGFHYLNEGDSSRAQLMTACALFFQPRDEVLLRALYDLCHSCGWQAGELLAELALSTSDFPLTTKVAIVLAKKGDTGHLEKMLSRSRQFFGAEKWLSWADNLQDSLPGELAFSLNRLRPISMTSLQELPRISCIRARMDEPLEPNHSNVWLSDDLPVAMKSYLSKYLDCTAFNSPDDNLPIFTCVVSGDSLNHSVPKALSYIVIRTESEMATDEWMDKIPKNAALYIANTGNYSTSVIAAKIANHIKNMLGNIDESITKTRITHS
jgi:hypothetical protein